MNSKEHIYHKIRGSYPGYIAIELPNDYKVMLVDEDNFNAYRKGKDFQAMMKEVKFQYCHFSKPVDGSWYIIIEGEAAYFDPSRINVIYKSIDPELNSTNSSKLIFPTANTTQPEATMP